MNARAMDNKQDPFWWAAVLVIPGALAGLAALLRSDAEITSRAMVSAVLNSSLFTVAFCLITFSYFGIAHAWLCVGLSLMAGLGGNTTLGFVIRLGQNLLESYAQNGKLDPPPKPPETETPE